MLFVLMTFIEMLSIVCHLPWANRWGRGSGRGGCIGGAPDDCRVGHRGGGGEGGRGGKREGGVAEAN